MPEITPPGWLEKSVDQAQLLSRTLLIVAASAVAVFSPSRPPPIQESFHEQELALQALEELLDEANRPIPDALISEKSKGEIHISDLADSDSYVVCGHEDSSDFKHEKIGSIEKRFSEIKEEKITLVYSHRLKTGAAQVIAQSLLPVSTLKTDANYRTYVDLSKTHAETALQDTAEWFQGFDSIDPKSRTYDLVLDCSSPTHAFTLTVDEKLCDAFAHEIIHSSIPARQLKWTNDDRLSARNIVKTTCREKMKGIQTKKVDIQTEEKEKLDFLIQDWTPPQPFSPNSEHNRSDLFLAEVGAKLDAVLGNGSDFERGALSTKLSQTLRDSTVEEANTNLAVFRVVNDISSDYIANYESQKMSGAIPVNGRFGLAFALVVLLIYAAIINGTLRRNACCSEPIVRTYITNHPWIGSSRYPAVRCAHWWILSAVCASSWYWIIRTEHQMKLYEVSGEWHTWPLCVSISNSLSSSDPFTVWLDVGASLLILGAAVSFLITGVRLGKELLPRIPFLDGKKNAFVVTDGNVGEKKKWELRHNLGDCATFVGRDFFEYMELIWKGNTYEFRWVARGVVEVEKRGNELDIVLRNVVFVAPGGDSFILTGVTFTCTSSESENSGGD